MGLFDKGVDPNVYEKFKSSVEGKLGELESKVTATANESAEEAQRAVEELRLRKQEIDSLAIEMRSALDVIKAAKSEVEQKAQEVAVAQDEFILDASSLKSKSSSAQEIYDQLQLANRSTQEAVSSVQLDLEKTTNFLTQAEAIPATLEALSNQAKDINEQSENIKAILTQSLKRKSEIDEVYKSILGHEIKDADGNSERIDGLYDELRKSFDEFSERIDDLNYKADEVISAVEAEQLESRELQKKNFEQLIAESKAEFSGVSKELKSLMPGALAAGLSAAYEEKKDEEARFLSSHERSFRYAVGGLVAISLIPFAVDVYLLSTGSTLATVLKDTPRLIISILPLYFPVLWLAYSANKRLNLSKRLIEEYTHKSVLGKTFSGLSNQIDSLPHESAVKEELRTRLLFNVLQVSAENPGKLITDYNKTDHPLMDVLEKSARLSESVDALSKIPGLSALTKRLASKRDALLREQQVKIEDGLSVGDKIENIDANSA